MRKNGILKDYLFFVNKRIPNMEKLGTTLTKSREANFRDMSLVIFSHESLLEYKTILKKKLFQTLQCILQILLSLERFFGAYGIIDLF